MNYKNNRFRASCFALFLSLGLISCSPPNYLGAALSNPALTSISELKPQNGEITVYLKGKVIDQAPLLSGGAYQLQDETGTIWVLTNQTPPKPGEEVMIQGKVTYQSIPISNRDIGEIYILEVEQLDHQTATQIQPTPSAVKPSSPSISPTPNAVKPPSPSISPTPNAVKPPSPSISPTPNAVKPPSPSISPTPSAVKPPSPSISPTPSAVKPSATPETAAQVKPTPKPVKPTAKPNTDELFLPHKQNNKQ